MSFTKQQIIDMTIKAEGWRGTPGSAYVNNPNDLGGETNFGITYAKAQEYRATLLSKFSWDGTMKNLSLAMAQYIYEQSFWQPLMLDVICASCPNTAYVLYDIGVNCGTARAAMWLQNLLNALNNQGRLYPDIQADGKMGPGSIAAFSGLVKARGLDATDKLLETGLLCTQGNYYIQISLQRGANETFTAGWLNRVAKNISLTQ